MMMVNLGNSAGMPILGQIRSHDLSHVLIIVVRYFGGTKLGISGLVKAYKEASNLALLEAGVLFNHCKNKNTF